VIREILRSAEGGNYRFRAIVQGIVASPGFRMRSKAGA
jgi:hypothetical protein